MTIAELGELIADLVHTGHGEDLVLLECEHDNSYGHKLAYLRVLDGGMVAAEMNISDAQSIHMYATQEDDDDEN